MSIGEAAKIARQNAGLTRKQLAIQSGYGYPNIRNIEENIINPRIDMIVDIADTLGITIDEYIGYKVKSNRG